jgi:hypothetical protein
MATAGPSNTSAEGAQNENENATYYQPTALEHRLYPEATDSRHIPLFVQQGAIAELAEQDFGHRVLRAYQAYDEQELRVTVYRPDQQESGMEVTLDLTVLSALPSRTLAATLIRSQLETTASHQQTSLLVQLATQQAEQITRLTRSLREKDDEINVLLGDSQVPTPQAKDGKKIAAPLFTTPLGNLKKGKRRVPTPIPEGPSGIGNVSTFTQQSNATSGRSSKLPDPEKLDTGRAPGIRFQAWKRQVVDKLLVNADHFPTELHQFAYVNSRTTGEAQKHLEIKYQALERTVDRNPVCTVEEIYQILTNFMENPFHATQAAHKLNEMKYRPGTDLRKFTSRFEELCYESDHPSSKMKEYLLQKLPYSIQQHVVAYSLDSTIDYASFLQHVLAQDLIRAPITEAPKATRRRSREKLPAPRSSTMAHRDPPSAIVPNTNQQLKCYNCGKTGHMRSQCPSPRVDKNVMDDGYSSESSRASSYRGETPEDTEAEDDADPAEVYDMEPVEDATATGLKGYL